MGAIGVEQISISPLKRIQVAGGDVLHAINCSDKGYVGFGEAYFSIVEADSIKAWKRHLQMTLNIVVPVGCVLFVFVDERGGVREETVGDNRYVRLTVPPGLWFGFKGIASSYSLLMNIADIVHDSNEIERKAVNEMKYNWKVR
jgi:dTDP-4-dehydrorhamnose 3,5-epimerase